MGRKGQRFAEITCDKCKKTFKFQAKFEKHTCKITNDAIKTTVNNNVLTSTSNDLSTQLISDLFFEAESDCLDLFVDVIDTDNSHPWLNKLCENYAKDYFNIIHININSVNGGEKRNGLDLILKEQKFDLITIQESKLGNDTPSASLKYQNYNIYRRDRHLGGGGLLIYVKDNHKVVYEHKDEDFETICLGILIGNRRSNYIITYNPHFADRDKHLPHLEKMINKFNGASKTLIIGDLNQDLLTNKGDKLKTTMNSYNFANIVDKPTHLQGQNETLLDCVFTNDINLIGKTEVIDCPFSNHSFVFVQVKFNVTQQKSKTVIARVLNDRNLDQIKQYLESNINLFDIIDLFDEPDEKFFAFTKILGDIIDSIAPLKKFRVRNYDHLPWFDKEMHHLTAKRDIAHSIAVGSNNSKRDSKEWDTYREIRNECKSTLRKKQTEYFRDKNGAFFGNSKKYWQFYNSIVKTKKDSDRTSISNIKLSDGAEIQDRQQISNEFNRFFGGFKLPNTVSEKDAEDYIDTTFLELKRQNKILTGRDLFMFQSTDSEKVVTRINQLNSTSSPGNCDISVKVLKYCAVEIAKPLAKIFNSCIATSLVTNQWKFAIVTPLFKGKGSRDNCDNYRGISVLQPIAKVFERILAAQIVNYFDNNGLFCQEQNGFRSGHSCETALQSILDNWKTAISGKKLLWHCSLTLKKHLI